MAPPKFMGLTGRPLSLAVSTVATTGITSSLAFLHWPNLGIGFVLFGYDQGVMSGIITAPAFNNLFTATKGNSTMQGFVTAIYEIGTATSDNTGFTLGLVLTMLTATPQDACSVPY